MKERTRNNQQDSSGKRFLSSCVLGPGHAASPLEVFKVETQERHANIVPSSQAVIFK